MSDEAVYRTAPATPGLLIIVKKVIFVEKGNTHVMPGHQEKNHVTIEIIFGF